MRQSQAQLKLLEQLFTEMDLPLMELIDAGFHLPVERLIKTANCIATRKGLSHLYGKEILAKVIKQKKYRESFANFCTDLRSSKNFRDRQNYVAIARGAFEHDPEVFKKHFAKSLGQDMIDERVKVV